MCIDSIQLSRRGSLHFRSFMQIILQIIYLMYKFSKIIIFNINFSIPISIVTDRFHPIIMTESFSTYAKHLYSR